MSERSVFPPAATYETRRSAMIGSERASGMPTPFGERGLVLPDEDARHRARSYAILRATGKRCARRDSSAGESRRLRPPARAFRGGWLPCGRWLAARLSSSSVPRRARARLRFIRPSGTITPRREPAAIGRSPEAGRGARVACPRRPASWTPAPRSGRLPAMERITEYLRRLFEIESLAAQSLG